MSSFFPYPTRHLCFICHADSELIMILILTSKTGLFFRGTIVARELAKRAQSTPFGYYGVSLILLTLLDEP